MSENGKKIKMFSKKVFKCLKFLLVMLSSSGLVCQDGLVRCVGLVWFVRSGPVCRPWLPGFHCMVLLSQGGLVSSWSKWLDRNGLVRLGWVGLDRYGQV